MSAYMIARINVTDWDVYKEYTRHTPRTIAQFGGRFIARAAEVETLEGEAESRRIVILEFPDQDQARAWYYSDEYQAAKKIRENAGVGQFVLVGEFPEADWLTALAASEKLA